MVCIAKFFLLFFLSSLRMSYNVFCHIHPFPQLFPNPFPFLYPHNFLSFFPIWSICAVHKILDLWSSIVVDLPGAKLQSLLSLSPSLSLYLSPCPFPFSFPLISPSLSFPLQQLSIANCFSAKGGTLCTPSLTVLGFGLTWACKGLVHAVTTSVCLFGQLPCCVLKTISLKSSTTSGS